MDEWCFDLRLFMKRTLFCLFIALYFSLLSGQLDAKESGSMSFITVGDDKTIPYGVVTCLLQDQQGFIWIGTQRGLVRYDGYRFVLFSKQVGDAQSIADNFIHALHQTQDGTLWIATQNGLSQYLPEQRAFKNFYADGQTNSLTHNHIRAITSDQQGNLWLGSNSGLVYLARGTTQFTHYQLGLVDSTVNSLLFDSRNQLWVGSANGLYQFDRKSKKHTAINPSEFNNKNIQTLFLAQDDQIWLGTKQHGAAFMRKPDQVNWVNDLQKGSTHHWVSSFMQPNSKQLWLSTYGGGVSVLDASNGEVLEQFKHDSAIKSSVNVDTISSLLLDDAGILWIGTWGGGLNKVNVMQGAFRTLRYSPHRDSALSDSNVRSIIQLHDGRWLFGTSTKGIDVLDEAYRKVANIGSQQDLSVGVISALAQSEDARIWVGTINQGVVSIVPRDDSFTVIKQNLELNSPVVNKLLADQEKLWVGTQRGLNLYNLNTGRVSSFKLTSGTFFRERVNSLVLDKFRNLWIGTANGLYFLAAGSNQIKRYISDEQNELSLPSNQIMGLLVDSQNTLWVDTSLGLTRLTITADGRHQFERVGRHYEQPSLYVGGNLLNDDSGRIWTQWHVLNPTNWHLAQLIETDGVDIGTAWLNSYAKGRNGQLLYGGTRGVLVVDPTQFRYWHYQPKVFITELKRDDKAIGIDAKLNLAAENRGFSLEFSASDFSLPENNRYAYQLVGYDKNWVSTSAENRRISYKNLQPGSYQLNLKASNRNGVWSKHNVVLDVTVEPKWYQSFIFKIVFTFALISIVYLIYIFRVNRLKAKQSELKQEVKQRTQALQIAHNNLAALSEIGCQIAATTNLNSVLEQLCEQAERLMQIDIFGVGLYRQDTGNIEFEVAMQQGKRFAPYIRHIDDKQQLAVWVIENKLPILIRDAASELSNYISSLVLQEPDSGFQLDDGSRSQAPNSYIYVPMIVKDKVIGVMTAQSFTVDRYDQSDLKLLQTLGSYAAIAIDNADQIYQLDRANQKLTTTKKELEASHQQLEKLSVTDQLTGLYNRRFLMQHIQTDLYQSKRDYKNWQKGHVKQAPSRSDMVFFLIDLDLFKQVNDNYGHNAGDKVLVAMKEILTTVFRESDYIIRWGGEEFLAVARFSHRQKAPMLAERVRKAVAMYSFDIGDERTISLTCSIGFASYPFVPQYQCQFSWENVIEIADQCLYAAKKSGRNAWVGADGVAIENNTEFLKTLAEEPQRALVSSETNVMTSLESDAALIWQQPKTKAGI